MPDEMENLDDIQQEPEAPSTTNQSASAEIEQDDIAQGSETPEAEIQEIEPDEVKAKPSKVKSVKAEASEADAAKSDTESEAVEPEAPAAEPLPWYVLKVQVNREDSIREGLVRRISMHGLEEFFGEVLVPAEKVTEVRGGRKRTVRKKLLPGYLIVQMVINDDTWFLVRETPGIGDFTGSIGKPIPMEPHEVERLLASQEEESEKQEAKIKITFSVGDHVKVTDGTFENYEGDVQKIDSATGIVWVMINIFGRSTPVRFEYWQIESLS